MVTAIYLLLLLLLLGLLGLLLLLLQGQCLHVGIADVGYHLLRWLSQYRG